MRRQLADDTDNAPHDLEAVGTCGALTSIAAGGMDDEDMKGVAVLGLALDIQDVSCGAHVGKRFDVEVVIAQRAERQGLVEQRHINAADVGRLRHQIFIACMAKQRTTGEIEETSVVLDFDERHEVGDAFLLARQYNLSDAVYLTPIAGRGPFTR